MPTILIVDDSVVAQRMIAKALVDTQFTPAFAANGREALDRIDQEKPDLVLTDLLMPQLDGMQLVAAAKKKFPQVPIVIVTARGSEEAAAAALKAGAAGYVPKNRIATELAPAVRRLLDISHARQQQRRLISRMRRNQFEFELDTDSAYLATLNSFIQDAVAQMGICDDSDVTRLGVALDEALTNALFHGNLEISSELRGATGQELYALAKQRVTEPPFKDRKIHVRVELTCDEGIFVIRDEGPGFDLSLLPDPADSTNLDKLSGRGAMLMFMFMDEVSYNEVGNEVTLIKRRNVPSG